MKLFEMIKKDDLEGLVVKRKDGKYSQRTLWYKILNPAYTQKTGRHEFSKDSKNWRGRFTDAPMRNIGKMFPAVSLGTV